MRRCAVDALLLLVASTSAATSLLGSAPASAATSAPDPGCQADRRTVVHTAARDLGSAGTWEPCLLDTGLSTGEVGLGIAKDGTLLRSASTDSSGALGIATSANKGGSWTFRALPAGAPDGIHDSTIDPSTDRYFYTGLGSSDIYYTDDKGRTWHNGTFTDTTTPRQDWSKVFVGRPKTARGTGYANNVYYCNWPETAGVASSTNCYRSTNGGNTFDLRANIPLAVCTNGAFLGASLHGKGFVDPATGNVYLPINRCGHVDLLVSSDEMASWTAHTIPSSQRTGTSADAVIATATNSAYQAYVAGGGVNPVSAYLQLASTHDGAGMDAKGRLYAVWTGAGYLPYFAWSGDGGTTWSPAVRVSPAPVNGGGMPSLAVTPAGRVGFSYYGTTDGGATWDGYLTVTDNPTAATPVLQSSSVSRPGAPLMDEPCCWGDGAQEYTAPRWGPDGSLYAAFAESHQADDSTGVVGRLVPVVTAARPVRAPDAGGGRPG